MSELSLEAGDLNDLAEYLVRSSRLTAAEARRVIDEVLSFLDDTPESFVRRRHLALQGQGLSNQDIFVRLTGELQALRFRAPEYTERQIRRLIYG